MISTQKKSVSQILWDLWCAFSIIGIWPRFIEPNLISITKLDLPLFNLPKPLSHFKIVQFSDLHFSHEMSVGFLNKLKHKILNESPDLILFTGDFICYSRLEENEKLKKFLKDLKAPYGSFAILGNHDYNKYVSINEQGDYDLIDDSSSTLLRGFKRLFSSIQLTSHTTERAKDTETHKNLLNLISETPFKVLHNQVQFVKVNDSGLNICGLGEYSLGKCLPDTAFRNYQTNYPGIILSHNPDSLSLLKDYPGDLILSGHTHGGQVNLPLFRKKFTALENNNLIRGLVMDSGKKIYINRGIGSTMKFRCFAMPEILSITLKAGPENEVN